MLNYRSKPSQDSIFIEIAIWGADLVLCSAPEFGPHPGGSYGGRGGLSFYVGGKGRQWTKISHRKSKNSISHSVVILASEPDAMLINVKKRVEDGPNLCSRLRTSELYYIMVGVNNKNNADPIFCTPFFGLYFFQWVQIDWVTSSSCQPNCYKALNVCHLLCSLWD